MRATVAPSCDTSRMTLDLESILCTQCGLCCDGSLFADVELSGSREVAGLEVMKLDVEDDGERGWVLQQPCNALDGTRCSVYANRPGCCRTFACQLLLDVRGGSLSREKAEALIVATRDSIRRVHALVGSAEDALPLAERCAAYEGDRAAELSRLYGAVTKSIREAFLPD